MFIETSARILLCLFTIYNGKMTSMRKLAPYLLTLLCLCAHAENKTKRWSGDVAAVRADVDLILDKAGWARTDLEFNHRFSDRNEVRVQCVGNKIRLVTRSVFIEKVSTIYHGLFKLGFLFPHPRWQI